mgnify:CR=1 FL=1
MHGRTTDIAGRTPGQGGGNYSTIFRDYPGGVEYFEVYAGPIKTLYSQVYWAPLPTVEVSALRSFMGRTRVGRLRVVHIVLCRAVETILWLDGRFFVVRVCFSVVVVVGTHFSISFR